VGLSDAIGKERLARRGGVICSVCLAVEHLSDSDRHILDEALADIGLTSTAIARALESEGHKVNGSAVARHRRGGCRPR
jgi:hypothetical protein